MNPPQGRLRTSRRDFFKVAYEMRHVVHSVIRQRPVTVDGQQGFNFAARGTGFFVSPTIFVTCNHVVDSDEDPHQPGDHYALVANMGAGTQPRVIMVENPQVGAEINFFPDDDFAVLRVPTAANRPYASLSFNHVYEGEDIGVAGYPIAQLIPINNQMSADGLIYRVGRGPVGASYSANLGTGLTNMPLIEVNFLFVPGNSGGPVFLAENGLVIGYVQGFHDTKIREKVVTAGQNTAIPAGMGNQYVEHMHAVYSLAIKVDRVRATLQTFGVGI